MHTQQSGGITSTSLAGNAVLKKIGDNVEQQQQQVTIMQQNSSESDVFRQSVDSPQISTPGKPLVPVTKVQVTPVSNVKTTQVAYLRHSLNIITNYCLDFKFNIESLVIDYVKYVKCILICGFAQVILKSAPGMPALVPKTGGNAAMIVSGGSQLITPGQIIIGNRNISNQVSDDHSNFCIVRKSETNILRIFLRNPQTNCRYYLLIVNRAGWQI